MEETAVKFETRKGQLAFIPFVSNTKQGSDNLLLQLYMALKEQGLLPILFHENPDMSLSEFIGFFNSPKNLLQVFIELEGDDLKGVVGFAWVTDIVNCSGIMTRAIGSFCYFKEYWTPKYTDVFSNWVLDYWFNVLKIDTIMGMTPATNRLALSYIKRNGFKEVGRLPRFTTLNGEITDGIITSMNKEEFHRSM